MRNIYTPYITRRRGSSRETEEEETGRRGNPWRARGAHYPLRERRGGILIVAESVRRSPSSPLRARGGAVPSGSQLTRVTRLTADPTHAVGATTVALPPSRHILSLSFSAAPFFIRLHSAKWTRVLSSSLSLAYTTRFNPRYTEESRRHLRWV